MSKRKKHKSAVIIKGNPYYLEQGPDVENYAKYYKEIEGELRKAGYGDVTYDRGDDYTTPRNADLWVGHSRGAGALWKAPEGTRTLDITKYEDGYEEYKALMAKELKKRGYKRTRDFPVHLRPVPGPEHYTLTQRAKDAIMMHKVGERKKQKAINHTILIPDPPSVEYRLSELPLISSQYNKRYNPPHLQEDLDNNAGGLFSLLLRNNGVDISPKSIKQTMEEIVPAIDFHKDYFGLERPNELAEIHGLPFQIDYLESAQTPTYPSGHTTQAYYVAHVLSEKYRFLEEELFELANMVAQSRIDRGVHYPSDNEAGILLAKKLFDRRRSDYVKKAALRSQEEIWQMLKRRIPRGAHHVSGGLPDAKGISDVDIYLPRKKFKGLEDSFPEGTSVSKQGDDYSIYSIPGFGREVNVYATSNKAKQESVDHRRTMMELAKKYPQLERKAFAIKAKGRGSEPAWAEVLGLKGDPYEIMRNTDEVMRHAAQIKQASKRYRHRATLLLQDDQGRIFAKKEPPERVAKGVSRVNLPGGGVHENELETRVPTKREIIQAARKEALEELGIRIRNPRLLGSKSGELEDWWKDQQEKKRGVRFDGAAEHFVLAKPSKKDMSMYNIEGDAFKGQYYDLEDLDPLVAQDAKRDSAFAQFNKKQLDLMRGLQQKKASRRRQRSKFELPYNTDNFLNKYYQTRQGDVINYLSSKVKPNKPRYSVEGTLLSRSLDKKQG